MSSVFIWALLTLMALFAGGSVEGAFDLQADIGGSRGNPLDHGHASDEGDAIVSVIRDGQGGVLNHPGAIRQVVCC
jgi:hypothetical protein